MNKIRKIFDYIKDGLIIDFLFHKFDRTMLKRQNDEKLMTAKQEKKLITLLKYANKNCEYYKNMNISVKNKSSLKQYPFLTKELIRKNYYNIISKKSQNMIKYVAHTGGSTGEPLEFFNGPGIDDIFQNKLWKRYGYKNGDIILAMDGAKVSEESVLRGEYLYKKSKSQLPYGGYGLSSLYLNDENIQEYCDCILKLKPDFIRGYPSFVYRISKFIIDNNLKIDFKVKAIELTSESSYSYQHQIISKAFNCKVMQQYGHTESCIFAYTFDDTMRYYCEPLYGFVEIIDENGNHVKKGEVGEVVVTTLHNYVMPFIRYKTGDYACYGGKENGKVILNSVLGRTQDYIINRDGNKVLLTALIFAQHFDALGKMVRWQIEQVKQGEVILHIIKSNSYSKNDELQIIELFDKIGNVNTIFDYDGKIQITTRGKSMMLIQHIKI